MNELYFELSSRIGKKVWVHGFYGDKRNTGDGMGTLVDDAKRLLVDEAYPEASYARLSGTLPNADWELSEVLVYGEVKDYAVLTGTTPRLPTPVVVVEKSIQISPTKKLDGLWQPITKPLTPAPQNVTIPNAGTGTQASPCDRSVIISGGVDASNNQPRYIENLKAKFAKMKSFGFTDSQIEVFYDNGTALDVDGTNVVDKKATKKDIVDHLDALATSMQGSCTLTIFVTDHGTGYSDRQNYYDARVATTGPDATTGKRYAESSFEMDIRYLQYRRSTTLTFHGKEYFIRLREDGKVSLWKLEGGTETFLGADANDDGVITEKEAGNTDLDADGTVEADQGVGTQAFKEAVTGPVIHNDSSERDTDRDGVPDFRIRWDATAMRYIVEKKIGASWTEIARDANDDGHIDAADGGMDLNGDGDKNDTVGFHEGINLWGDEVLWDDELAALMKKLSDKGVHTMIEMVSCFSGGFVENVKGLVENIVTGSDEDYKHTNRIGIDHLYHAVDELTFLEKLQGIDSASWTAAWDLARAADDAAATASGTEKNGSVRYETPIFTTTTKFQETASGTYNVELHFPPELQGKVHDFEIIFGLQQPRWDALQFGGFSNLPGLDYDDELVPGGVRVFRSSPIPDGIQFTVKGTSGAPKLRIELTDINHARLGYTFAAPGTVAITPKMHASSFTIGFQHFSGFSHVKGDVTVVDNSGAPLANVTVSLALAGPSGAGTQTFMTNASGVASYFFTINQFGSYTVTLTGMTASGITYDPAQNVAGSRNVVVN